MRRENSNGMLKRENSSRALYCCAVSETVTDREDDDSYLGSCDDDELTVARLMFALDAREHEELTLECDSIYGAALLMPQLARSAFWPKFLSIAAARALLLHWMNILMQFWLLQVIAKEDAVYDAFGGAMYLCNFAEGVRGPSGSLIESPARLFTNFNQWNTRMYIKQSLLALFPERKKWIEEKVDPGEYGLESHSCRFICCILFIMSTIKELYLILTMARLLWHVPTRGESWLEASDGEDADSSMAADLRIPPDVMKWLNMVRVRVAGMPLCWKLFGALFVLIPKVLIWRLTLQTGITYLMDTAGSTDLIINAVALGFILSIDELICEVLLSRETKILLAKCEGFPLGGAAFEHAEDDEIYEKFLQNKGCKAWTLRDLLLLFPFRIALTLVVTALFVAEYYCRFCTWTEEDGFISRPVYEPKDSSFNFMNTILPNFFPVEEKAEPFWRMPDPPKHADGG